MKKSRGNKNKETSAKQKDTALNHVQHQTKLKPNASLWTRIERTSLILTLFITSLGLTASAIQTHSSVKQTQLMSDQLQNANKLSVYSTKLDQRSQFIDATANLQITLRTARFQTPWSMLSESDVRKLTATQIAENALATKNVIVAYEGFRTELRKINIGWNSKTSDQILAVMEEGRLATECYLILGPTDDNPRPLSYYQSIKPDLQQSCPLTDTRVSRFTNLKEIAITQMEDEIGEFDLISPGQRRVIEYLPSPPPNQTPD